MKSKPEDKRKRPPKLPGGKKRAGIKKRSELTKPEVLRFAVVKTELGSVLVAGSVKGIAAILLGENPSRCVAELEELFPEAELGEGAEGEERAAAQVAAHVDDPSQPLDFPLDLRGTPFQVKVWKVVRRIPPGRTLSYADVARKIGAPRAMRAVGSTCAKCRHLFAVPCHRVTGSGEGAGDGAAAGRLSHGNGVRSRTRPGADRRAALLRREIELISGARPTAIAATR